LHYTLQVAEALDHAARRDVVHRDIKPSNVLVMQNGTVKVVDMGLARLHQVESPTNDLTASGVTLGTFDYISPEQARDPRNADVRSDLYSLGCTLYYMLTGRPPFAAGTVLQKLLSHSSEPPPDPRELRPELHEEVTDVIHRLLAKNPVDRFQSPAEFIARLLLLADELGLNLPGRQAELLVTRTPTPITRLEATLPWVVPVVFLAIVVLLIEIFSPAQQIAVARPILQPPIAEKSNDSSSTTNDTARSSQSNTQTPSTSNDNRQPATTNNTAQLTTDSQSNQNQSTTSGTGGANAASNGTGNATAGASSGVKPSESSTTAESAVAPASSNDQSPAIAADNGNRRTNDQGSSETISGAPPAPAAPATMANVVTAPSTAPSTKSPR
jgi:serine/threonine-protein kinase